MKVLSKNGSGLDRKIHHEHWSHEFGQWFKNFRRFKFELTNSAFCNLIGDHLSDYQKHFEDTLEGNF